VVKKIVTPEVTTRPAEGVERIRRDNKSDGYKIKKACPPIMSRL
jgi:hypothetical protein